MPIRSRRAAFTLLELLVAMAILSTLTVALYASLRTAFRARDLAEERLLPARAATLALDMLALDLASSLSPAGILAGEFNGLDAAAESGREADTLILHSCAHEPDGETPAGDVRRVEFALAFEEGATEGTLVRRATTVLLSPEVITPTDETLCRDVRALNFRYFDGAAWLDAWDAAAQNNQLPRAVEVTLEVGLGRAAGAGEDACRLVRIVPLPCSRLSLDEERMLEPVLPEEAP